MWRTCDVGSIAEALPFEDARVVAGADGLNRPVARALLVGAPEDLDRVGPSDLVVLTAATLFGGGERSGPLAGRFDAVRVAGLIVRSDGVPFPMQFRRAADRLGLPVITFPETTVLAHGTAARSGDI